MATAGDRFHEALALHQSGRGDEAEPVYRELLRNDPSHAGAWHLLGLVLHKRGDLPGALEHIQKALALCGQKAVYWNNLGVVHKDLGRFRAARAAFERAIALRDTYADAWSNLGLMQVESGHLEEAERSLRYALRLEPRHADALRHMAVVCREKGDFEEALRFCRDAAAVAPEGGKVFEIEGGVLAALRRFDEALSAYGKAIRETECDLVVHWHAGSDVLNYFLPFLPLAPHQCIGFGANGTTGIPNIDHFVSSRLFERGEGAEDDYTEQLVEFDGLTTWQARPPVARGTARSDFGLLASGPLYFCPQQIGKFHPRFDFLLRRILEEVPAGHIVVLSGRRPCAAEALRARLERTLGTKLSKQVVFLPSQPARTYYRLLDLADVVLDSPVFSTSLTGFDALSAGKPIVTIPGEQMAERYALGLYRLMGLGDLIAASATEYVALAVRLGTDSDFRESICERIRKRCSRLYENRSAVREYEDFFGRVVRQGQAVRPAG